MYAKGTLHSHSAIAPFGSPNAVLCGSLVALHSPLSSPLRYAKLRIPLTLIPNFISGAGDDFFNCQFMTKSFDKMLKFINL